MTITAPSPSRSLPVEYYILDEWHASSAAIGVLNGKPIARSIIDGKGEILHFAGIAPRHRNGSFNTACLREGEWIVRPGLIYGDAQSQRTGPAPHAAARNFNPIRATEQADVPAASPLRSETHED